MPKRSISIARVEYIRSRDAARIVKLTPDLVTRVVDLEEELFGETPG